MINFFYDFVPTTCTLCRSVIRTHVSRDAPHWDLWRKLYWLRYSPRLSSCLSLGLREMLFHLNNSPPWWSTSGRGSRCWRPSGLRWCRRGHRPDRGSPIDLNNQLNQFGDATVINRTNISRTANDKLGFSTFKIFIIKTCGLVESHLPKKPQKQFKP